MPTRPRNPYDVLDEVERIARIGSCEWTPSDDRHGWSDNFYRLLGLEPRSATPSSGALEAVLGAEQALRLMEAMRQAAAGASVPQWTVTAGARTLLLSVEAMSDPDDGSVRVLGAIQDITAIEEQKREVDRYARMLEQAQSAADIGSFRQDLVTGEIWWSQQLYRIMGVREDHRPSVEGFDAQVHPDDREALQEARKGWRADQTALTELRVVRPSGEVRRVQIHRQEVSEPLPATYGVVQDITERHELEQQLRAAQTYEAVGRLAAGVAHDFNNLLTVIMGDVALVQETHALAELDGVLGAARRAAELTAQLLSLGRSLQVPLVPTDLDAAVEGMQATLEERLPDRSSLHLRLRSGATIRAEKEQLRQVLVNLVAEARDAMQGEQGVIEVRTRRTRAGVTIEVEDRAPRVEEASNDLTFRGAGLARAIVEGAIANMRGRLEVVETALGGTIARVWFPVTDEQEAADPAATTLAGLRVLVVEDEPAVRRLTARILGKAGMLVSVAADPSEAAAMAGPFDVVLSDVVMPEGGGQAVMRDVERRLPGTPIVFMTGYSEQAGWLVDQRVLHKPFQPRQLIHFVQAATSRHGV
ncbi:MAG: response regulator [Myxococcales bacterium]|nr:response regulator [Myxococcales bacterium]